MTQHADCRKHTCILRTYFLLHLTSPVQVFVDHPSYHRPGNLYGDNFGAFGDNQVFLHQDPI